MKFAIIMIAVVAALIVGGGLLLDSIVDRGSSSLLGAVSNITTESVELKNYGPAPEFVGIAKWQNSEPLTMSELRGKVVLIDFWTYSCINCIRTFPYVTGWYEKYKDKGLVIVGVHTPEFAFEKDSNNVQTALKRHKINYPVAQDNEFGTWTAYNNRYWPAHYLVDQQGNVVYYHFGEGQYQETEQAIQQLLGLGAEQEMSEATPTRDVKTPEIYFGLKRLDEKYSPELVGSWTRTQESVQLTDSTGRIKLDFYARDVHMVAKSAAGSEIKVFIDGQLTKTLNIDDSNLYTLFEGSDSKQRTLELEIVGAGLEAFTFTFG